MAMARLALLLLFSGVLCQSAGAAAASSGDAQCLSCHKEQGEAYAHTAHRLTSQLANRESVLGSFQTGSNVLMIADPATAAADPGLYFKMEARPDGFFQTAVAGWPGAFKSRSERMDIVIGSGVRGQSFLSWRKDQLFELPVSYWSAGGQWINSPGYKNGTMNFSRAVTPRCLECHATSIKALSPDPLANHYERQSLRPGITCERCHGDAAAHMDLHTQPEKTTRPAGAGREAILNPARFSRDRQVDLCALCHNGIRSEELAAAFTYVPGEALDKYLQPAEIATRPDVHGNQVGLLKSSRCYLSSPGMSCSTCHDVHQPERTAASYSSRCLSCHQVESCGMAKKMGPAIAGNCIDCHMPVQTTNAIVSETAGRVIQPKMRNHWIKVYPAAQ
jgi:hypothetical protein